MWLLRQVYTATLAEGRCLPVEGGLFRPRASAPKFMRPIKRSPEHGAGAGQRLHLQSEPPRKPKNMKPLSMAAATLGLIVAGCAGPKPSTPSANLTDARFVAADDNFAPGLVGAKATARLDAINGVPTGAWRLDRGAGATPAGPVNLLVGLWIHDKLLPLGSPDTYACIQIQAEPQAIYTVAAVFNGSKYVVVVHNTSFNPSSQEATFEVVAKGQATPPACGKPG